jgi:hypothetical protein
MGRAVIQLHIEQDIPTGEDGEQMIDRYIDGLRLTDGSLTARKIHIDYYEDENPDGSLKMIDIATGERF